MPSRPNIARQLLNVVAPWLDLSFIGRGIPFALPTAATLFVTIGQSLNDKGDWAWVIGGIALLLANGGIELIRGQYRSLSRQAGLNAADTLRVALKDALQPIAEMLVDMQGMSKPERKSQLKAIARQSCGALTLLLKDVSRLRAVIYCVEDQASPNKVMSELAYTGRSGARPQEFREGNPRGDAAFVTVGTGATCFVENTDDTAAMAAMSGVYQGTRSGYSTFISAPIVDKNAAYGMVTIDAPGAGDLVDTDKQLVMLIADLMAIAFASVREPS